jgi:A/G-specific adenine glycosylase
MQLRRGRFPKRRNEIEELPGIGQYIASAILLFSSGAKEPLLDVNMARVLERCFSPRKLVDIRYDPWLQALARMVVDHKQSAEINWAVLDLAAAYCSTRQPDCVACPLRKCCRYAASRHNRAAVSDPVGTVSTPIAFCSPRSPDRIGKPVRVAPA